MEVEKRCRLCILPDLPPIARVISHQFDRNDQPDLHLTMSRYIMYQAVAKHDEDFEEDKVTDVEVDAEDAPARGRVEK